MTLRVVYGYSQKSGNFRPRVGIVLAGSPALAKFVVECPLADEPYLLLLSPVYVYYRFSFMANREISLKFLSG